MLLTNWTEVGVISSMAVVTRSGLRELQDPLPKKRKLKCNRFNLHYGIIFQDKCKYRRTTLSRLFFSLSTWSTLERPVFTFMFGMWIFFVRTKTAQLSVQGLFWSGLLGIAIPSSVKLLCATVLSLAGVVSRNALLGMLFLETSSSVYSPVFSVQIYSPKNVHRIAAKQNETPWELQLCLKICDPNSGPNPILTSASGMSISLVLVSHTCWKAPTVLAVSN